MVAVQQLAAHPLAPGSNRRRPASTLPVASRPSLRLIEGGANKQAIRTSPSSVLAVAAVMATVMLVLLVRGVQGAPPAAEWNDLAAAPAAAAVGAPGSAGVVSVETFTVGADDTWSSIAAAVAPNADPVEVARQLAGANGGYALEPGQVLTVALTPGS